MQGCAFPVSYPASCIDGTHTHSLNLNFLSALQPVLPYCVLSLYLSGPKPFAAETMGLPASWCLLAMAGSADRQATMDSLSASCLPICNLRGGSRLPQDSPVSSSWNKYPACLLLVGINTFCATYPPSLPPFSSSAFALPTIPKRHNPN